MKLAFFSSSSFTIPILQAILDSQGSSLKQIFEKQLSLIDPNFSYPVYTQSELLQIQDFDSPIDLAFVVSQPASQNRGKMVHNPISTFCNTNNIKLFTPENLNKEVPEELGQVDMAITASYGQFVSTSTLSTPKNSFINWHPSLLPKYRGATPMQMTLLSGDQTGGISWINMTKQMDAGEVYLQLSKDLVGSETFVELSSEFGFLGSKTWAIAVVNKLIGKFQIQNEDHVVLCSKLEKENRLVNPTIQTATQIFNQWRAYTSFPGTSFADSYFGGEVKILECNLVDCGSDLNLEHTQKFGVCNILKIGKKQIVYLECADNSFLEIQKVGLKTGKQVDFRGYQF